MDNYNKIKLTQEEANKIYEITKDEPYPPVKEVEVKETPIKVEDFLTEEEQEHDKQLFADLESEPQEDKGEENAS